jgi:hypothetical protein
MTEQVLTTDEGNYIIMTVYEIVERLRAERDEYHETNKRLRAQRGRLLAALQAVRSKGIIAGAAFVRRNDDGPARCTEVLDIIDAAIAAVEEKP